MDYANGLLNVNGSYVTKAAEWTAEVFIVCTAMVADSSNLSFISYYNIIP